MAVRASYCTFSSLSRPVLSLSTCPVLIALVLLQPSRISMRLSQTTTPRELTGWLVNSSCNMPTFSEDKALRFWYAYRTAFDVAVEFRYQSIRTQSRKSICEQECSTRLDITCIFSEEIARKSIPSTRASQLNVTDNILFTPKLHYQPLDAWRRCLLANRAIKYEVY